MLVLDVGEPLSAPAEVQYSHHGYYKKPVTRAFGWSPDGKRVALNAQDLSVLVWDLEAQKVVHRFKGHTRPVVSLLFLPDNHTLVSASSDYTVRFWNLDTGQPRGTIVPITGPANRRVLAAFSVDGHYSISPGHEPSLKYIVEDRNGVRMDKEPGEFFTEFNWVNDPKQVRLDGREH